MDYDISRDSPEAFLLKECYDLAVQYEKLNTARDVLREKSKRIGLPDNYIPTPTDLSYRESDMQIISEALAELTNEGFSASGNAGSGYGYRIGSLPGSGEKEYLLALMALRSGTNETQRTEALKHLINARSFSPNDPRYKALAQVLEEAGR